MVSGVGALALKGKGGVGLYGHVMGDCVIAVQPCSCRQAHHRACWWRGCTCGTIGLVRLRGGRPSHHAPNPPHHGA